jgi:hypothetical protein
LTNLNPLFLGQIYHPERIRNVEKFIMLDTQLSLNQNFGWTKRQSKERRKSRKIIITIINRSIQLREWEETMMDNINLTLVLSRLNLWSMVKIIFFTWEIADLKYKIYIFYNYLKLNHLEFICYLTKRTVVFIIQVLSFFYFLFLRKTTSVFVEDRILRVQTRLNRKLRVLEAP